MRVKVAIGLVVAFLATMLSVGPASAGVTVIERANGDVLINGDGGDNHVDVIFCEDGTVVVYIGDGNSISSEREIVVADDLTINLKGGNDRVSVGTGSFPTGVAEYEDCELQQRIAQDHEGDPDIPGNLKILGASGGDNIDVNGISIGKDLTVSMSSGDNSFHMNYVHVGDDLTVRASGGRDRVNLYDFWIHDRMDINLSAGDNYFYFGQGSTARAIIRGHNGNDRMNTGGGGPLDLGHNPAIISAGGTDDINMYGLIWTGKLRANSGSGSDYMSLSFGRDSNENGAAAADPILDLDTAAGNDEVHIHATLISGDDLNGGPGMDTLYHRMRQNLGASIKNFENEIDYDDS